MDLSLLNGISLARLTTKLTVDALPATGSADFYVGQTQQIPATGNPLLIGDTVKKATDAVLAALLGQTAQTGTGLSPNGPEQEKIRQQLATQAWQNTLAGNTCSVDAPGQAGYNCRRARWQAAVLAIESASTGLQGFLGTTLNNSVNLLGDVLTLNVVGILNSTGGLVGGLVSTLDNTLKNLLGGIIPTNQCASYSLLGGYQGNEAGCIKEIAQSLQNTPSANQPSNAVIGLLGALLGGLQQPLNAIGTSIVKPAIENVVGLNIGQTDVKLMSLQCNGNEVQLVY